LLFIGIGATGAVMAARYAYGSTLRMGPGYFPTVLSWGTIVLGAIIAHYVGGVFGGTTVPRPDPGPGELIRPGVRFSR